MTEFVAREEVLVTDQDVSSRPKATIERDKASKLHQREEEMPVLSALREGHKRGQNSFPGRIKKVPDKTEVGNVIFGRILPLRNPIPFVNTVF